MQSHMWGNLTEDLTVLEATVKIWMIVDAKSDPRLLGKIFSLTGVFYVIGKCSNVVRSLGEYARKILLEVSREEIYDNQR